MIAEALQYIATLGRAASDPKELPGLNPRSKTFLIGGEPKEYPLGEPARRHNVNQLSDVIEMANRFDDVEGCDPVVWYDESNVTLVIDDDLQRIDTVTFDLVLAEAFETVKSLRQRKPWMSQKDFVRLLKIDLAGCLDPGILLERVRKVRWEQGSTTTGTVTRSSESLGREIAAKVDATGEIPELVRLVVPIYSSKGERCAYTLACSVEVDAMTQVFRLLPLPDEIERVQQLAVDAIGDRLVEGLNEGIPSYYGSP